MSGRKQRRKTEGAPRPERLKAVSVETGLSGIQAIDEKELWTPGFAGAHKAVPHEMSDMQQSYPIDRIIQAHMGKLTAGISPISLGLAFYDWAMHLSMYPGKQTELMQEVVRNIILRSIYLCECGACAECDIPKPVVEPKKRDRRFENIEWDTWPFNFYQQSFLLRQNWWDKATKNIRGVSQHHQDIVNFTTRQILDFFSPSNYPWTNPQIIEKTEEEMGRNFLRGYENFIEDLFHKLNGTPRPSAQTYRPGHEVAVTPGKVIYRNRLIELIQYAPQTTKVYAEPVLIVPAWIMKYYILDLSPENSLVKYLVGKGHTVFMISWKNPDPEDSDLDFEDYLNLGVMESLDVVRAVLPDRQVHAVGYCLGGTLLMMAAAWMARHQQDKLCSVTLFASQTDFEEGGELTLFMDESQLAYLEDNMWQRGYLDGSQMAGAFNMLRSNDLIWSRMVHDYLIGERRPLNDLMAWNTDVTRMPFRMHSQYLRSLYLNNELSEGHFRINGQIITLTDIKQPVFTVSTIRDHISPWQSVYEIHLYTDTDVTFVLTTGGHNAGIVSEPGHPGRSYQISTRKKDETYIPPTMWAETTDRHEGSWWPAWQDWLMKRSSRDKISPPSMGAPDKGYKALCNAPGTYVMKK